MLTLATALDQELGRPLTLAELAGRVHYSPYHFERTFAALTGSTPMDFVRQRRLLRAAQMLRYDPDRALDIALACGYGNASTFSRAFRQRFGFTPRDWRHGAWRDYLVSAYHYRRAQFAEADARLDPEWIAWRDRMEAKRREVADRIVVKTLAPRTYWCVRHFDGVTAASIDADMLFISSRCLPPGREPALWCMVSYSDNGLLLDDADIMDFGVLAQGPAPAGLIAHTLPGGLYASLLVQDDALMQWMHEDWLDHHPDWTMDCTRPYVSTHTLSGQGELLIPLCRRLTPL
ncbi:helix-turn-helix transcriptional regulator [Chitinibacteraceae bacterium HSL-7]